MLSDFSTQYPVIRDQRSKKQNSAFSNNSDYSVLTTQYFSQRGFSPLAILILVVLGVFIIWELTYIMQGKFDNEKISPIKTATPLSGCNFPDESDPCDLDSGAGFDL